jgi:YD repeat-containing protein
MYQNIGARPSTVSTIVQVILLRALTSVADANGNTTGYAYDQNGNLLTTTYADGSKEQVSYDPLGNAISYTNRRGQPIGYAYNTAGQITKEAFPDGTENNYSYDAHGNLVKEIDPTGTTTFTYDSADRLTQVTYPGGLFLQFSYDSGGRRIQMIDQTGFTANYAYDSAGRLSKLTAGGGNLIVVYTYDPAGNLSRQDKGNGTYSIYQYNANGNVLHLINYAPDSSINSRFDYTYDNLGQETTEATVDGAWTYSYDGTSQLTHAVFASTNPSIPDQDLAYNYDPVGNRISTIINGTTTPYVTNNLNEYTSVGGAPYAYDADGNLVSDSTSSYTYDALNQLTGVSNAAGTSQYTYDGLGNRVATVQNGQPTRSLIDPTSLPSVIGQFGSSGNAIAHFAYGLGLTSQLGAAGSITYYDFDALGSTAGVSDSSSVYSNTYAYEPFGGLISSSGTVPNAFQCACLASPRTSTPAAA